MRSYNRFIVDQEIECVLNGARDYVMLYNLSSGGCMIEISNPDAAKGDAIDVVLKDMGAVPGKIVWKVGRNAGVKFETILHQRVVEYFGFSGGQEDFDQHDPRDRFGIPLIADDPYIELLSHIGVG
ncbi:PilZ domain-containing protein [Pontixanthobacter sp.]|uniref:PilZ domain-containing protein n=1 Tax=Pontixanthobacter sp. TaxID=2792078 RepID=UPI003C7C1961